MAFLLLHFWGPMQSWGSRSRFEYRDTEREPTFSGVVGLLAGALGLSRNADLLPFRRLQMIVRADNEGQLSQEFQTAQDVLRADGTVDRKDAQLIYRDHLTDAEYHVTLEGEVNFLKTLLEALHNPVYPPFLGRRAYVPAVPIVYPGEESLIDESISPLQFLTQQLPVYPSNRMITLHRPLPVDSANTIQRRFVVTEDHPTAETRLDVPLSFHIHRREYVSRFVRTDHLDVVTGQMEKKERS